MPDLLNTDWQTILVTAVLRLVGAAIVLLIGRALAGFLQRFTRGLLQRMRATPSLVKILERGAYYGAMGVALFIALVILGIPAEMLLIVVAVLFVIAAIALRESLRDLAAYVNFLVFQPFKTGDQIETNGLVGTVQEMLLFSTVLTMLDNRKLVIPNANIQNSTLINYSAQDNIRLDLPVAVSYATDLNAAKRALLEIANADARVLVAPPPLVDVMKLGDNGVELVLRVFTQPDNFWELRPALTEQIKREFEQKQLEIPFPQVQIHVNQKL